MIFTSQMYNYTKDQTTFSVGQKGSISIGSSWFLILNYIY